MQNENYIAHPCGTANKILGQSSAASCWCSHASLLCPPHEKMVQKVCKILMTQGTRSCHHFTQAELTARAAGQWRIKPAGFAWEDAPQSWKMDLETSDELCQSAVKENHC